MRMLSRKEIQTLMQIQFSTGLNYWRKKNARLVDLESQNLDC